MDFHIDVGHSAKSIMNNNYEGSAKINKNMI